MIKIFDYLTTLASLETDVMEAVRRVLHSNQLILGPETEQFEHEFARFVGARFCVGVASGTAALQVALLALDVGHGDEVITVANTCPPTAAAIRAVGASPRFVDIDPTTCAMDAARLADALTPRTRCVLPVHLWGNCTAMHDVLAWADARQLPVIEDCAQAVGTLYEGRHAGTFGELGAFSFYPTKNLGAFGDAGAIITNNSDLAGRCRRLRVYDVDDQGVAQGRGLNARISEMQAAILRAKLPHLPKWLDQRRRNAEYLQSHLKHADVRIVPAGEGVSHSHHQFVVRCDRRDALRKWLDQQGVATGVHYPVPLHWMPAFSDGAAGAGSLPHTEKAAVEILSLPVHEGLRPQECAEIVESIQRFPAEST